MLYGRLIFMSILGGIDVAPIGFLGGKNVHHCFDVLTVESARRNPEEWSASEFIGHGRTTVRAEMR